MANSNNHYLVVLLWGVRGSAVVRALASQQCGPGSNSGVDAICGLSLLLVLSYAPRGFSPGTPVFPSPQKPSFPNSTSTSSQVDKDPVCGCATSKSLIIIYLIYYLLSGAVGHDDFRMTFGGEKDTRYCSKREEL